jgi:hypothetical protein
MTRGAKPTSAAMMIRMKRLPHRHRIAHLRALIQQQPVRSIRRLELVALLRAAMTAQPGKENRAI